VRIEVKKEGDPFIRGFKTALWTHDAGNSRKRITRGGDPSNGRDRGVGDNVKVRRNPTAGRYPAANKRKSN